MCDSLDLLTVCFSSFLLLPGKNQVLSMAIVKYSNPDTRRNTVNYFKDADD